MSELTFAQESVKKYGKKLSYAGGRYLRQDNAVKCKKKHKAQTKSSATLEIKKVQGGSVGGNRLCRVQSLLEREKIAESRSSTRLKSKTDKSLMRFGQGVTGGKQKAKGTSKPPRGHAPTSQAHIDVFYAGASKKWDVPPPEVHPIKLANVK